MTLPKKGEEVTTTFDSRHVEWGLSTRAVVERRERIYWLPTIRFNVTNQRIYDADFSRHLPVARHSSDCVRFATWLNGFRFTITSSINIPTRRACCCGRRKAFRCIKVTRRFDIGICIPIEIRATSWRLLVFLAWWQVMRSRIGLNKDQLSEKVQTTMLTSFHHVELLNIWMREILLNHMLWSERSIESRSNLRNVSWLP